MDDPSVENLSIGEWTATSEALTITVQTPLGEVGQFVRRKPWSTAHFDWYKAHTHGSDGEIKNPAATYLTLLVREEPDLAGLLKNYQLAER